MRCTLWAYVRKFMPIKCWVFVEFNFVYIYTIKQNSRKIKGIIIKPWWWLMYPDDFNGLYGQYDGSYILMIAVGSMAIMLDRPPSGRWLHWRTFDSHAYRHVNGTIAKSVLSSASFIGRLWQSVKKSQWRVLSDKDLYQPTTLIPTSPLCPSILIIVLTLHSLIPPSLISSYPNWSTLSPILIIGLTPYSLILTSLLSSYPNQSTLSIKSYNCPDSTPTHSSCH